jgi:O-succinylbenzoic acid--CoA ligase
MVDWLAARARTTPHALALVIEEQQWTYGALQDEVARYAGWLQQTGVERGQRVALLSQNDLPFVCLVHALARLGAVLVPLNTRLTAGELAWQLQKTGCGLFLYDDSTAELSEQLPAGEWQARHVAEVQGALQEPVLEPPHGFELEAPQAIVFTSGTTGRPKGAVLTFANHFWSATASAFRLGVQPQDCWLSCLPLYHVGGLAVLFRSCLYGTAVVLQRRFEVQQFNEALDHWPVTMTSLVPTMLYRLLPTRRSWPKTLRLVLVGGAATTPELAAACAEAGLPVAMTYGLTEAASQVATMLPAEARQKPGSVGKPLMFTEVRIVDEAGNEVPSGALGEVLVSGPTVMRGYYEDEEATAQALRGGRLHTGDIGYLDEDGDLWLVQRRSDIIVSGGENVYPAEVEEVLRQHPAVAAACVVGVPDAEWGQRVAAMVAVREGETVDEEALLAFCRERLAGYKLPRTLRFVERLPETASGKVARGEVRERLEGG